MVRGEVGLLATMVRSGLLTDWEWRWATSDSRGRPADASSRQSLVFATVHDSHALQTAVETGAFHRHAPTCLTRHCCPDVPTRRPAPPTYYYTQPNRSSTSTFSDLVSAVSCAIRAQRAGVQQGHLDAPPLLLPLPSVLAARLFTAPPPRRALSWRACPPRCRHRGPRASTRRTRTA